MKPQILYSSGYNQAEDVNDILDNAEKKILNVVKIEKELSLEVFKMYYLKPKLI